MINAYLATLEQAYSALTASIPSLTSGQGATCLYGGPPGCSTSRTITCTAGGGSGTFTYLWEIVSGTATFVDNTANPVTVGAGPYTSTSGPGGATPYDSTLKCTVTDTVTGKTIESNTGTYRSHHEPNV